MQQASNSLETFKAELINNACYRMDESLRMVSIALAKITEEQLWQAPNASLNSIGNLILHLCGNMTQYGIASLQETEDKRDRDQEFATTGGYTKAQLLASSRPIAVPRHSSPSFRRRLFPGAARRVHGANNREKIHKGEKRARPPGSSHAAASLLSCFFPSGGQSVLPKMAPALSRQLFAPPRASKKRKNREKKEAAAGDSRIVMEEPP